MRATSKTHGLLQEFSERRRDLVKTFGPALLIALLGCIVAFYFVEPPPPRDLVIAAGPAAGNYHAATRSYARLFADNGVTLISRETAGSVENYQLLLDDDAVHVAIVQGGTAPQDRNLDQLESLAALYLEPLWVFHRRDISIGDLRDMRGKRIAVGEEGSGTQLLSEMLLGCNDVKDGQDSTQFVYAPVNQAIESLVDGKVDAAFFVLSAESPIVRDLLHKKELALLSFERGEAYARRYPFLKHVVLARGVVDLQLDLPRRNVNLIAPVANLVVTRDLPDAFVPLLLEAAMQTHEGGSLVNEPFQLPSLTGIEFAPNAVARHYVKNGPSFFQDYFGFWVASLIDRTKILLVPLIILLIPLAKVAPPIYRWRIRSRIYRWYALLRGIDQSLRECSSDKLRELAEKLNDVEQELCEVNVPLSYMEEFYQLRLHIELLQRRVDQKLLDQDG